MSDTRSSVSNKTSTGKKDADRQAHGLRGARRAGVWNLRLYVAGQTPRCLAAFANLKKICEQHLAGTYEIQVVDLLEDPKLSEGDQILAIPTLVRRLPPPVRKIIGDLSNTESVLVGLDLRTLSSQGGKHAQKENDRS